MTAPPTPEVSTQTTRDPADTLVGLLYEQARRLDGRKPLIDMRASLGARGGIAPSATAHVARYVSPPAAQSTGLARRRQEARERATYLVAGLFSLWHVSHAPDQDRDRGMGVGRALRVLSRSEPTAANALLTTLTRQPQDQMANPARRMVTVLAKQGVRLDWFRLAHDLTGPEPRFREAQRRWACDFHSSTPISSDR